MCKTCISKIAIPFLMLSFFTFPAFSVDFYVSPDGDDTFSGTREMPFKTLKRAVQAAQKFFQQNENDDCFIWLFPGDYFIIKSLELNSADL